MLKYLTYVTIIVYRDSKKFRGGESFFRGLPNYSPFKHNDFWRHTTQGKKCYDSIYRFQEVLVHIDWKKSVVGQSSCRYREVGGWGRDPFSRNFMKPTPRRKWYLTTGRRFHWMVLDPIPQSLPVHFFGSRPQPPTSPDTSAHSLWLQICDYMCLRAHVSLCPSFMKFLENGSRPQPPTSPAHSLWLRAHVSLCPSFKCKTTASTRTHKRDREGEKTGGVCRYVFM